MTVVHLVKIQLTKPEISVLSESIGAYLTHPTFEPKEEDKVLFEPIKDKLDNLFNMNPKHNFETFVAKETDMIAVWSLLKNFLDDGIILGLMQVPAIDAFIKIGEELDRVEKTRSTMATSPSGIIV